jgi:hypothetical protein
MQGDFLLTWDDKTDGSVEGSKKHCVVRLRVVGKEVFGEFTSDVEGTHRNALFLGHIDSGKEPMELLTLRQIEEGYTCSYQITCGYGAISGTWRDTRGGGGDVVLQAAENLLR